MPPKLRQQRQQNPPQRSADTPEVSAQPGQGWAEAAQQVLQHAVTATVWFDPDEYEHDHPLLVRFTGRRAGAKGRLQQGDRFGRVERIDVLVPGSGPVSVTTKVPDVTPGEWVVWARPAARGRPPRSSPPRPAPPASRPGLRRFLWARGNPVTAGNTGSRVTTRPGVFSTGPGLIPMSWVVLVALGVVAALVVQAVLAAHTHLSIGAALAVSLSASVAGAVGARLWYVVLNRGTVQGPPTQGLCIQGFIAAAGIVLLLGLPLAGLPIGTFLDISTPGLFFAMAIGRQGCFLAGCCTGRPTGSRWAIWASDGRVGARRAPTQQFESLTCLVIGVAALLLVLSARPPAAGTVLVGALASYTVARQLLFPYSAEPRRTSLGRRATLIAAGLTLTGDIIAAIAT